jgi:hypothetical protein
VVYPPSPDSQILSAGALSKEGWFDASVVGTAVEALIYRPMLAAASVANSHH